MFDDHTTSRGDIYDQISQGSVQVCYKMYLENTIALVLVQNAMEKKIDKTATRPAMLYGSKHWNDMQNT